MCVSRTYAREKCTHGRFSVDAKKGVIPEQGLTVNPLKKAFEKDRILQERP